MRVDVLRHWRVLQCRLHRPGEVCNGPEHRGECIVAPAAAEQAPTLAPWALSLTAALLGIIGIVAVRRRGTKPS